MQDWENFVRQSPGRPYTRDFAGMEIPMDNSLYPELEPYHKMDPSKLRNTGM